MEAEELGEAVTEGETVSVPVADGEKEEL